MIRRHVVFLDKDGTLLVDVPYNVRPELMVWAPGAVEGLKTLQAAGFELVVITNQAGVARGLFAEPDLLAVEKRLRAMMAAIGVPLLGFYYCPHHPDGVVARYTLACNCRKPEPGMVLRAIRELDVEPGQSWFIGDILNDVEAGRRAGCKTIMLDNGGETEWLLTPQRLPDYITADLAEAARIVLHVSRPEAAVDT
jgi:histidinol-phosphate phosphatase family protein